MAREAGVWRPSWVHLDRDRPGQRTGEETQTQNAAGRGAHARMGSLGRVPRAQYFASPESHGPNEGKNSLHHSPSTHRLVDRDNYYQAAAADASGRPQSPPDRPSMRRQPKYQQKEPIQGYTPGLLELVEFFRTYEPPVGNLMSGPLGESFQDERGRWLARLKHMGAIVKRTKSVSNSDRPMQLPDSAVSGRTSAGHRHIAIAIPNDASPYGTEPRSQYPVFHANDDGQEWKPSRNGRLEYVRFTNQQGGITILPRMHEPLHEQNSIVSFPGFSRLKLPPIPGPPPTTALPEVSAVARPPSQSKSSDHLRATSESVKASQFGQDSQRNMRRSKSNIVASRRLSTAYSSQPPAAMASMHWAAFSRPPARPSIDSTIAPAQEPEKLPCARGHSRLRSTSSDTEDEETILGLADAFGPDGTVTRWLSQSKRDSIDAKRVKAETRIEKVPSATTQRRQEVSPARSQAAQERRDKVRDLKKRDVGNLRREKKEGKNASVEPLITSGKEQPAADTYVPTNSFSPIMVVANVEPVEDQAQARAWSDRKRRDLEITTPATGYVTHLTEGQPVTDGSPESSDGHESTKPMTIPQARRAARKRASVASALTPGSGHPTPPQSPAPTPKPQTLTVSEDRTSLARRREWRSASSKIRTPVEQGSTTSARTKRRGRGSYIEQQQDADEAAQEEEEFLKLYDFYREYRLRDMEKRVKRLERHGDAWRRALTPVLETLSNPSSTGERRSRSFVDRESSVFGPEGSVQTEDDDGARPCGGIGHCSTSTRSKGRGLSSGGRDEDSPVCKDRSAKPEGHQNVFPHHAGTTRERVAGKQSQPNTA